MPPKSEADAGKVVLGIDPGLRVTGYGLVRSSTGPVVHLAHGAIRTEPGERSGRLLQIHERIRCLISDWRVDEVAIEKQFVALNANSAFVIGEVRASAVLAAALGGIPVFEYTPAEVKQAVTSYGRSGKEQIQQMVRLQFALAAPPQPADAADALAIAICHAARRALPEAAQPGHRSAGAAGGRTRRWRNAAVST